MPHIRIPETSRTRLDLALRKYRAELVELAETFKRSASLAGLSPDGYYPPRLLTEIDRVDVCRRLLVHAVDNGLEYFGRDVHIDHVRTFSTALALHLDDIQRSLEAEGANPLTPSDALQPLADASTSIRQEFDAFWNQYGSSDYLHELRMRRSAKLGLHYPQEMDLETALADGEGQAIESMEQFPENARELAKEIAAFASSNPGHILVGVDNAGKVAGIQGCAGTLQQDKLRLRVEGVSSNSVVPPVAVRVRFEQFRRRWVMWMDVPRGPQPFYSAGDVPYVRHGTMSRPAQWLEVVERVRTHLANSDKAAAKP